MSTASIAVPEAFRYIFGAIATTGDRRKEAVMDWARILAYVTGTVGRNSAMRAAIEQLNRAGRDEEQTKPVK